MSLYSNPRSRVVLNDYETEYFDCPMGVKQGDTLSPTLFAVYINDLALHLKESNIGIELDETTLVNVLCYADDIVLIAKCENDLQSLINIVSDWCLKWRLEINLAKTNIMHVRHPRKPQTKFSFQFDGRPVPFCKQYKYLGLTINEHLDFQKNLSILGDSANRALSSIISKMIKNGGFPFKVYTMLYISFVTSILGLCWGSHRISII